MGPKVSHEQGRESGNGTGNVTCRYQNAQNAHKSIKYRYSSRSGEERNGAPLKGGPVTLPPWAFAAKQAKRNGPFGAAWSDYLTGVENSTTSVRGKKCLT